MSNDNNNPAPEQMDDRAVLDDLIMRCYDAIKTKFSESAQLGDLLKMIELKNKLTPTGVNRKKFWEMLEQIRSEKFPARGIPELGNPREKAPADEQAEPHQA
jgi:hypothetical protein